MEAKPLQVVPSSHYNTSGGGPHKKIDRGQRMERVDDVVEGKKVCLVKEENPSSVELDLGVGANPAPETEEAINPVIIARHHKCCLFTEDQRRELGHQVLFFNHFAYNLHLPHHLVLPFFNGASAAGMSEYSRQGFDYGIMVDPEPNRCRRTDGKKWRCSKNVVPNQKYCERHMHRGRNRSRKPVETSEVNSSLMTKPSGKLHALPASNTEYAIPDPNRLGTSSCTPSRNICIVNTSSTNDRLKTIIGSSDCRTSFSPATVVSTGSTLATAVAPKVTTFSSMISVTSNNRNSLIMCKKNDQTKTCINSNMSVKSSGKGSIICDSNSISTGIGFSPRSVLQVSGCNNPYPNDRNSMELEPGRCRRTDGKKWRCKGAVLPGQKYCATHMHRGAKRRFADHEPTTATTPTSAVTIARLPFSTATTNIQKAYCTIPSTNLSMSIPASEPLTQRNEKSPSSSSSSDTDTTISDTMNEYSYASF